MGGMCGSGGGLLEGGRDAFICVHGVAKETVCCGFGSGVWVGSRGSRRGGVQSRNGLECIRLVSGHGLLNMASNQGRDRFARALKVYGWRQGERLHMELWHLTRDFARASSHETVTFYSSVGM